MFSTFTGVLFFALFMVLSVFAAPACQLESTTTATTTSTTTSNGVSLTGTHTGQGTYYETGLGACGQYNVDTDLIAAVGHELFDTYPGYSGANPNDNPICGKQILATYSGKSVTITIVDRCVGCAEWDLDFSPSAFTHLADESVGRISNVEWTFK